MPLKKSSLAFSLALSLLCASLIIGTIYATMIWATNQSDLSAVHRQDRLVELVVSKSKDAVAHDQESATVWDDAVRKVAQHDKEWIDANLGRWMHSYFGHNGAFVVAPDGQLIYGFSDDESDELKAYRGVSDAATKLVESLRRRLAEGDTTGTDDHTLSIGEADIVRINGRPAILSIKPIVSDSGQLSLGSDTQYIHIALRYLDGDFADAMGREYLLTDMRFEWHREDDPGRRYLPVTSKSGDVIGFFSWAPFTPGRAALRATEPALMVGGVIILVGTAGLVLALQRRSRRLKESQGRLMHLAHHDALSGLPNRASFDAIVARTLARSEGAVLFLDLDRFKKVNDTLGHAIGDQLIREVAARLKTTAGSGVTVARIGGDEFTILVAPCTPTAIEMLAEKLISAIRQPFTIEGQPIVIGLSIGVAFSAGAADTLDVLRRADIALYQAKAAGRNRYAIFGSQMDEMIKSRRELEYDLRSALKSRDQIEVHYQPIFSAADGGLIGVEALTRWRHPTKGFVQPDVFIGIAEEAGIIGQLGELVLATALAAASRWPALSLAVNASALELRDPGYALRVTSALERASFNPARLEIEITESTVLENEQACQRNIDSLRRLGVRFALDDFGTGFSSFGRLQQVAVDRIKIDRCFVSGSPDLSNNEAIVQAIIHLAHAQGMKTTAEGIETDEQRAWLRELGCDELQGYLLSRPVKSGDIDELYRNDSEQRQTGSS
ncbi:EAL domain-containing protein [Rhizobium cauense]|uniref:putative bifunctional diguanylate cyclase/phosphodiesterase n=1 Tax=Rhizobium cauense TaxID=1166683 RepID=UPI001C6E1881|nr:EAL domain-containing protein [Rhizobium cauense]MBW9117319.1 EAL domain-containing protein [Rhizobium cauense]